MEAWLHDWLSLLLRWAHLITGVAWIGASFYFNWLENRLQRRPAAGLGDDPAGADPIGGDLWAVHGGGFYYLQKYRVAPERLPQPLHWFKHEAYFTWLTGFALLVVVYYWNAELLLLDPSRPALDAPAAIALGIGSLAVSWLVYDVLCRRFAARHPRATGIAIFAFFGALAAALDHGFSGRAVYIHVGAAIGTVMAANVFFVIIPAQRELVAALRELRPPDPAPGRAALLRSRHNNYLTLPVLFLMISSHYPGTYGSAWGVPILVLLALAGVGIRHYFNVRHEPGRGRVALGLSLAVLAGLVLATMPRQEGAVAGSRPVPTTAEVLPLIHARCVACHAERPTFAGTAAPPLGVVLEYGSQLELMAERVYRVAVATQTMPPGNVTGMRADERERLALWYARVQNGTSADD